METGITNPAQNPAKPSPGTELCRLDEIAEPGARGFDFRVGEAVFGGFVVRKAGLVLGYVDSCPHAGWPLAPLGIDPSKD